MLILGALLFLGTIAKAEYNSYNTKTSYFWVYDNSTTLNTNQWTTFQFGSQACNAIHVSGVFRHGARWPGDNYIMEMTPLQNKLLQHIPNIDKSPYRFLKTWKNLYPLDKEKELIPLGAQEMIAIAGRLGRRMQSFLIDKLDRLIVMSANKQRAQASAKEFYKSLIKTTTGQDRNLTTIIINNTIVRYYDKCGGVDSIKKREGFLKEYDDFRNGQFFTNATDSIVRRLGLVDTALSKDEVELIYQMCPYDRTCFSRNDWCSMLSDDEKDIMGYLKDLETYYEEAYGHPLLANNSCPLMQNIFNGMDDAIKGRAENKRYTAGIFRFGHSETLIPFFAALGMFKDSYPIRADNYKAMKNRKFNTANMVPYSANLEFVLYECANGTSAKEHYLKLFHNEIEVPIPGCGGLQCKYDDARALHADMIDNCDLESICKEPAVSAERRTLVNGVMLFLALLFSNSVKNL
ncbi:hypothetical protein ACJMK2_034168 [Sinanodonta woodiana]|uniref:Multiple inositol polyphosphate phosphatase 1 n=1 Tax=Sinanodonta woodiana TaxID=1069815 RepID=A0ABD3WQP6_SINWO